MHPPKRGGTSLWLELGCASKPNPDIHPGAPRLCQGHRHQRGCASPRGTRSKVSCRVWFYPTFHAAWDAAAEAARCFPLTAVFFLGAIPTTSLRGVWSAPTHVSIHNDFGGRRRELGAGGGSGVARVAERVAALGLSGVAAFCISKCALSAGALGRNCHLLPHCQPRRGYASFADSQPPALITRSTPSLEPPGQSRHIPSRCCTDDRRAGAGASTRTAPRARPCPRASLRGSGCS